MKGGEYDEEAVSHEIMDKSKVQVDDFKRWLAASGPDGAAGIINWYVLFKGRHEKPVRALLRSIEIDIRHARKVFSYLQEVEEVLKVDEYIPACARSKGD